MEIFGIRLFPDEAEDASPIDPKRGYRLALILLLLGAAILAAPRCIEPLKDPYHRFRSRLYTRSAEAFLAKGDAASARIQLANAIRHDGDNSRPWLALAGTLDAEGSPESARALVRAWACEPHRTDFAIAALRACLAKDNRELANALGDTILKRHPDNPEIWYLHGAIWIRSGNLRPGYAALRRARELAPQDARFLITIASLEGLADDPSISHPALLELERLRDDPAHRRAATDALAAVLTHGDPARALALIDESLQARPDDLSLLKKRWELACRLPGGNGIAELRDRWPGLDPAQRAALLPTVAALLPPAESLRLLAELPQDSRSQRDIRILEFRLLARAEAWDPLRSLAKAVLADPGALGLETHAWVYLGIAQHATGDAATARLSLRGAREALRGNFQLAFETAELLSEMALPEEAAPFFEVAASPRSPWRPRALRALAPIYQHAHRDADLLSVYRHMLADQPDNLPIKNNIAALLLSLGWDPKLALALAQDCHTRRPDDPAFADTYACALCANGKPEAAVAVYDSLPNAAAADPVIRLHRADALVRAGQRQRAFRDLASISPDQLPPSAERLFTRLLLARDSVLPLPN